MGPAIEGAGVITLLFQMGVLESRDTEFIIEYKLFKFIINT